MMNNDKIIKIHRNTCRFIHNGTCKYFDKGTNYMNNKRPKKNKCRLEGHERNVKEICTYCCTYCCKSMVFYKHIIKFRSDMTNIISEKYASNIEALEVDDGERSTEKEIGQVVSRQSNKNRTPTNNFIVTGRKYNKEGKKKPVEEEPFNTRIKSNYWKRHKSINRYIQKYKCNDCEKLHTDIK